MERRPNEESLPALDDRTRFALAQIADFADAGARLVARGQVAYGNDAMLKLAGEAIMRRLNDAVSRLDGAFLAAHPTIDWTAMTATRDIGAAAGGRYDEYWHFLATRLPTEVLKVHRILSDWASRPPPFRPGVTSVGQPDEATVAPSGNVEQVAVAIDDENFRQLVERLDDWAANAFAPNNDGPIDLMLPDGRTVRIVMSADDLSDMLVVVGTLDGALVSVMEAVRNLSDHTPYLVYGAHYALEPSTGPTLPAPDWGPTPPPGSGGRWVAYAPAPDTRSPDRPDEH